ncbi:juvenile hormone acid O-methyltransferase [Caerostris extrusa]|uniref:Juvenile hormone acid O-methyltransferase n=1 Tax=Caerostris extrusa TaxID=172846 RepID=A0AAV4V6W5_CAEEX|nr:juvenile hormone acid O-methyltransferase [Caerostris extrusa]
MTLDAELYNTRPIPFDNVKLFFKDTLPQLGFGKSNEKEIVFDVGCGPGGSTYQLVLPLFRFLEKLFAIDMLPNMIEMARKHNSHPKYRGTEWLTFLAASAEEALSPFPYRDNPHAISKCCIDVTHLSLPRGQVYLFRFLEKLFAVDMLPNMIEMARKHNSHPNIEYRVANIEDWSTVKEWEDQITKVVSIYCFHWLKDIRKGFYNMHRLLKTDGEAAICFDYTLYGDLRTEDPVSFLRLQDFFASISTVKSHIPVDKREEFKNELFDEMMKLEGRDQNGSPLHRGRIFGTRYEEK